MKYAYVDSSVWVTRSEGLPQYRNIVLPSLIVLENQGWRFCISELVMLEVLPKPHRQKQEEIMAGYKTAFENTLIFPSFEAVFRDSIQLAISERLKAADVIHVAFALRYECELFVTTDPHFKNLNALPLHWINLSQNASL